MRLDSPQCDLDTEGWRNCSHGRYRSLLHAKALVGFSWGLEPCKQLSVSIHGKLRHGGHMGKQAVRFPLLDFIRSSFHIFCFTFATDDICCSLFNPIKLEEQWHASLFDYGKYEVLFKCSVWFDTFLLFVCSFVWTWLRCFDFCCQISGGGSRRQTREVNCSDSMGLILLGSIPAPQEYGFDGFRFGGVTSMLRLVKMVSCWRVAWFERLCEKDGSHPNQIASVTSMMWNVHTLYCIYSRSHLCHLCICAFHDFHQVSLPWNWKAFRPRLSSAWISERKSVTRSFTFSYTFHSKIAQSSTGSSRNMDSWLHWCQVFRHGRRCRVWISTMQTNAMQVTNWMIWNPGNCLFENRVRSGTYLMLANYLVKRLLPRSGLTIAEDRRLKSSSWFYLLQRSISSGSHSTIVKTCLCFEILLACHQVNVLLSLLVYCALHLSFA